MIRQYEDLILRALKEDRPTVDMTSEWLFGDEHMSNAKLIAKENGVLSGLDLFKETFSLVDARNIVNGFFSEGDLVEKGDIIAEISGPTKRMLLAERTALNFIQRMSGIATLTREYVLAVEGLNAKIVDTRKTAPGLRLIDKQAVRTGGGQNHRFNLSDGVLIKDNHIKAAGGIWVAIGRVKSSVPHTIKIEIEVETLKELEEAITAGADIVMLDNMSTETMKEAVMIARGRVVLEASGNMSLDKVREVAETGVDLISVGALTHSVKALDLSLKFE
ncbi:MAG TPA: carboxylating nicotinate-nucleotide diphosphorylase [Clostridiales bacterium UBA8960]|jgi:nicotinate-nucleotide pyrophosphorylase (carboxylating)|nr:carboxylating nicotinate-nucleotide diphosphorylase [Clostridiales bacterium UBA8960]